MFFCVVGAKFITVHDAYEYDEMDSNQSNRKEMTKLGSFLTDLDQDFIRYPFDGKISNVSVISMTTRCVTHHEPW